MARRIEFNKDYILEKSLHFIVDNGINNLNARSLCKYIGCSTQPLFKNFESMDVFKKCLKKYLHDYYDSFINQIVNKEDYLYTISYAYALFALEEANIFNALFMTDLAGNRTIDEVLKSSWNIETIESIPKQYGLSMDKANHLYRDVRFYTHGLACQISCNSINVTKKEISELIRNLIDSLRMVIK